jgi:putative heme-binding domain-containing protein
MSDDHPAVGRQAFRVAEPMGNMASSLVDAAAKLADDPDFIVRIQLACSLGEWSGARAGQALAQLAVKNSDEVYLSAAVMSSAVPHYAAIVDAVLSTDASMRGPLFRNLLNMALALDNRDVLARLLEPVVKPGSGNTFTGDQLIAWSGWLDLLASRNRTPEQLARAANDSLTRRLAAGVVLADAAREWAIDDARPLEERAAGASLLARDPKDLDGDLSLLTGLLTPQTPPQVQRAVVRAIARGAGDKTPGILTASWGGLSPEIRVAAVDLLLGHEPWAFALLQQVEAGKVGASDIDVTRRGRLEKLNSPRVAELAKKVLGETSNAARAKVVEAYEPALKLTGDVQRGLRVYVQHCAVCHKYGDQGNEIGPDLRSVRDWPADSILANILDPNRKVEPKYLSYQATLNNGDVAFGVITAETGTSLTIKGLDGKDTTVVRADVKSLEGTNRSLMPDGLEATINKQQMADLIRFLKEPPATASR